MDDETRGPRRLLMTADAVGGVWTYALELGGALARGGTDVTVAVLGGGMRDDQRRQAAAAGIEVHEAPFRLEWMDDPWDDVAAAGEWLQDLARRTRADLVHLNGYVHGALRWPVPCVVVAHSCVLSWWAAVHRAPAPLRWARYREAVARGLAAADRVVAPTRAMLRTLQRHYGVLPGGSVIPNGRRPAAPQRVPKEPLVLGAGRLWDEAKNLAALDEAARRVAWPVCVAGEETSPDGRTHRPHHARALGRLDAVALADVMARASIFAAPARYEPFGLAPLEAALAGCALVLGDIDSLRETWQGRALFVPPDDADALARAIDRLIADRSERNALAAAARAHAQALTPDRMAEAYRRVYADAFTARGGARAFTESPA